MPDVRLSGDFLGFKAGETVDLSPDEYSDALRACVVGKTYPRPVVGVKRREHVPAGEALYAVEKKAPIREGKPPQESYGVKPA